jgi:hypothetical protein
MTILYIVSAIYIIGGVGIYLLSPLIVHGSSSSDAVVMSFLWPLWLCVAPFLMLESTRGKIESWSKKQTETKAASAKELADIEKELDNEKWGNIEKLAGVRVSSEEPQNGSLLIPLTEDEQTVINRYRRDKIEEARYIQGKISQSLGKTYQ